MADWLKDFKATRSTPNLWVEHAWILESREPLSVIRKIVLRPGINVVWAQEPEDEAATGREAAGHGVGKTSLSLLLRYALCDDADTIGMLRDELLGYFPQGGIAATVHVGSVVWAVFRPFSGHRQALAVRDGTLESIFSDGANNQFEQYQQALANSFVQILPVSTLPGSGQAMEWRHILAWRTRDQRTRFDNFFHWRSGEGIGFRRARQDPPLLMRAVLGILDIGAAKLIADIETAEQELSQLERKVEELQREPTYNLNRVEQALRRAAKTDGFTPMEAPDLITPGVLTILESVLAGRSRHEEQLEHEITELDRQRQELRAELSEIDNEIELWQLETSRIQALLDGNQQEYERLSNEISALRNKKGRCALGDVEFADCDYIKSNTSKVSFLRKRDETALVETRKAYEATRSTIAQRLIPLEQRSLALRGQAKEQQTQARKLEIRSATSVLERDMLVSLQAEYRELARARNDGKESADLILARKQHVELEQQRQSALMNLEIARHQRTARAACLTKLTGVLAERLLGSKAFGWFDEQSDSSPFRLAVGGEAFHVLEVLLGDIVCLVDAITCKANHHPGFVIHDCPREADMGAHLYQDFLVMLREIEESLGQNGQAPFQYVLTTTSPPPIDLRNEPFLRLVLKPGADDDLLFKRRLSQQPIELPIS